MTTSDSRQEHSHKPADWNKRYREGFYAGAVEPHELLKKFWRTIPGERVVDIAMGNGRDVIFLSKNGFFATGLESSVEAIKIAKQTAEQKSVKVHTVLGDARALPYRRNVFDAIIVFYFLKREIIDEMKNLLKKDGIFIYETFLKRQNNIDRQRNPNYLLDDGELIGHFTGFELLFYEEIIDDSGSRRKAIARAVGRKL